MCKLRYLATRWCNKKPIYFLSNIHVAERDGLAIRRHNKKGEAIMVNVIIGTETWLHSTINSNEIIKSTLGFNVYRKDRPNKSYDCSNKRFDSSVVTDLDTDCEILWVQIDLIGTKSLHIGSFYRR